MTKPASKKSRLLLLLLAGAKGAVGSTVAAAVAAMQKGLPAISSFLTTADLFPKFSLEMQVAGWDPSPRSLLESIGHHGVLEEKFWEPCRETLERFPIRPAPEKDTPLPDQVNELARDLRDFRKLYPDCLPVLVNLLPASAPVRFAAARDFQELVSGAHPGECPDLAYAAAAVLAGLPFVNFTSNEVEVPSLVKEAEKRGVPLCGRDGKTGQTYLKVLLASALKARCLRVKGWYSLNILGNQDGENLADPSRARGKLANKTEVLESILGYPVGSPGTPGHKVAIDYYPLRGDAKEAWDVIDFEGLFGLPMSLRLNLMARDSILAAPLVLDLARWMAVLQNVGRSGLIPELGFFFKKPLGPRAPVTFQDQLMRLNGLADSLRTET